MTLTFLIIELYEQTNNNKSSAQPPCAFAMCVSDATAHTKSYFYLILFNI